MKLYANNGPTRVQPKTELELARITYTEAGDVVDAYKLQLRKRTDNAKMYNTPFYWDRVAEAEAYLSAAEAAAEIAYGELRIQQQARTSALAGIATAHYG